VSPEALRNGSVEFSNGLLGHGASRHAVAFVVSCAQSLASRRVFAILDTASRDGASGRASALVGIAVSRVSLLVGDAQSIAASSIVAVGGLTRTPARFWKDAAMVWIAKFSNPIVVSRTDALSNNRAVTSLDNTLSVHALIIAPEFYIVV
jgi:hypothetical protein